MSDKTFPSVWHRAGKKGLFELLAFKDSGTLVVRDNRMEFTGKDQFVIDKVLVHGYRRQLR